MSKYNVTINKNEFVEVLIFRLKGKWGPESRRRSPRLKTSSNKRYVFPTEVLKLDEKQSYRKWNSGCKTSVELAMAKF